MELRRFLAIVAITMVFILAVAVWFLPPSDDFGIDNPFWNGTEHTRSIVPFSAVSSLFDLPSAPGESTLILIPYVKFTPPELNEVSRFVNRGGTLVLADDYGFGNQVLEYLGLKARFSGQNLLDPLMNYKNQWFPRIYHVAPSPITSNSDNLIFNHATALLNVDTDAALAWSSSTSFLDLNGNERWDNGEPTGPLPVISQHNLGSGKIILVADPSILINSMENKGKNDNFLQNIASTAKSGLLIDLSHLPTSNLRQTKSLLATIRDFLTTPLATLGLVAVALTITLIPIWYKKRAGSEE